MGVVDGKFALVRPCERSSVQFTSELSAIARLALVYLSAGIVIVLSCCCRYCHASPLVVHHGAVPSDGMELVQQAKILVRDAEARFRLPAQLRERLAAAYADRLAAPRRARVTAGIDEIYREWLVCWRGVGADQHSIRSASVTSGFSLCLARRVNRESPVAPPS